MAQHLQRIARRCGGTLPDKRPDHGVKPSVSRVSESIAQELVELGTKIADQATPPGDISKALRRMAEIGGAEQTRLIIQRIEKEDVNWVVKQDALETLGHLGGARAEAHLVKELTKPVPQEANLEDYGDTQAILRSQAALARPIHE